MDASSFTDALTLAVRDALAIRHWGIAALVLLQALCARGEDTLRRLPPTTYPLASTQVELASYSQGQPLRLYAGAEGGVGFEPVEFELGAEFDRGIFIRSTNLEEQPYALYVGGRLQLRHTGFARSETEWTDSAGVTRTIRNRNQFDAERVRLNLSGTVLDPKLTYLFIFDGDSDGGASVDQLVYFLTYEFHPALQVRLGRWKAASDREWLLSSRFFRMVDRAMATEYFRAGFSDGIWLLGNLGETCHYEASLTNGLRTSTIRSPNLDDNLTLAFTMYCDPFGPYGFGEADYACHADPVVRIGSSFAFEKSDDRNDVGLPLGESGYLRLSDGTLLAEVGALAPGVRVLGNRLLKASIDAGLKWRGWSLSGECFFRSIQDITADGPIPVNQLNDYGFRADAGVFIVPQRFDINLRMSQVSGLEGDAFEYSLGCNWYWGNFRRDGKLDDRVNKVSFDVTELKGTPTFSAPADLVAGDDGVLFRTQVQIGF